MSVADVYDITVTCPTRGCEGRVTIPTDPGEYRICATCLTLEETSCLECGWAGTRARFYRACPACSATRSGPGKPFGTIFGNPAIRAKLAAGGSVIHGARVLAVQPLATCGARFGCVYDRRDFSSWFTFVDEHGERERFWTGIAPGEVVVDVGAAYGSYVLPALARGARVVAFTPRLVGAPTNNEIECLLDSAEWNGWAHRLRLFPCGLYSRTGYLDVFEGPRASEYSPPERQSFPAGAVVIPVTTLDALQEELALDRLDWLKLDVEGAEAHVLIGARETIRRFRPKVLVECHLFKANDMEAQVEAVLAPLGYVAVEALYPCPEGSPQNLSHVLFHPKEKIHG